MHHEPLDTPISGPDGNPDSLTFTDFGCPVYSAGPAATLTELLLIETHPAVLAWQREVARAKGGYKNPPVEIAPVPRDDDAAYAEDGGWGAAPELTSDESTESDDNAGDSGGDDIKEVEEWMDQLSVDKDSVDTKEPMTGGHQLPVIHDGTCTDDMSVKEEDPAPKPDKQADEALIIDEPARSKVNVSKPVVGPDGVPEKMREEVLAALGCMENLAAQRLEEGGMDGMDLDSDEGSDEGEN